jgi:hypothetical protein
VFLTSNPRECSDPLGKVAEIVVWGKSSTPHINFGRPKDGFDPVDNMFDNPLIKLVQNVQGDGLENICPSQLLPKWVYHSLDSH